MKKLLGKNVFLENSTAHGRSRQTRYKLASIEQAVQAVSLRMLSSSNSVHQILLKIAQDAAWLLAQENFLPGLESTRDRYFKLLIDRGLASYAEQVRVNPLIEAFKDYYSPELLKLLQGEIREQNNSNWLLRLMRPPKHSQHPLYHLLLIQFLSYSAREFFQLSGELKPFGDGSWPCLNPVCIHFRQPQIQEYTLKRDRSHGRMTATFCCECGFTYARLGPDQSPDDRFRVGKVTAWGQVWEDFLKQLWEDSTVSLEQIANRLSVDRQTVKRQAARLGLTFPRPSPTWKQTQIGETTPPKTDEVNSVQVEAYREEWLEILRQNPDAGRAQLSSQHSRVHSWL
ncbi:hypothetical protein H6F67_03030 [Microcoleus sp. FACHB-1515]|nr:hypothetical protein [Microcoleus sp. FACHB-1515]